MKRTLVLCAVVIGCGGPPARTPAQRGVDSTPAVAALQASRFEDATRTATTVLTADPHNAKAAAVRAIASYVVAGHELVGELMRILRTADHLEFFDHAGGRAAWQGFLTRLAVIEDDLAVASADHDLALELCLACWERDWNRNGRIDERDRKLFELEFDGQGGELAEGDPRRRPTFRFDAGDLDWARAMIAFQRAAGELVLAYKWSELDKLFRAHDAPTLTIHLIDPARVTRARQLILAGLDFADRCRRAYLAETDDDREWVPNPRQRSHPMPLEMDDAVYRTWEAVIGDLRRMLRSEDGLALRELARAADDHLAAMLPDAYVDLGRLLGEPADIVIDLARLDHAPAPAPAAIEAVLRGMLQHGYQARMRPSPLVARLRAMKDQLDRGEDTFERKLRYLLWLN